MIKQKKISLWLKGLCIFLAVMLTAFFVGVTYFKINNTELLGNVNVGILVAFSWLVAILCYIVLFNFWKVCEEIGKDNSFSLENARSFHNMALCSLIALGSYVSRIVYLLIRGTNPLLPILLGVCCIFLCIVFIIICEALSQLIRNAYEVKLENDLTI